MNKEQLIERLLNLFEENYPEFFSEPGYEENLRTLIKASFETGQEYGKPTEVHSVSDSCPRCKNVFISCGDSIENCPTFYDTCHCCTLCEGFPKCYHGKWTTEECLDCEEESIEE